MDTYFPYLREADWLVTIQTKMVWANLSHPPPSSTSVASSSTSYSVPSYASWFDLDQVHDIEKRALPEFFAPLPPSIGRPSKRPLIDDKTPAIYQEWRDWMVKTWRSRPHEYLSITVCRRHLTGDVGAMMRVHAFLEQWGIINYVKGDGKRDGSGGFVEYPEIVTGIVDVASATTKISSAGLNNQLDEKAVVKCAACQVECPRLYYSHVAPSTTSTSPSNIPPLYYSLCGLCYAEGKYPSGLLATDFVKVDVSAIENSCRKAWSEEEVLKLLEAVEKHPKDWERVSKIVGKPKDQCIFQFLKLPAMESIEFGSETFTELDKMTAAAGSIPFNISENPIMSTLSFLAATVHPKVAAAAAQAALEEVHKLKESNGNETPKLDNMAQVAATSIACAATRASQFADDEIRKISKLTESYFELELAKLRLKMSIFEDLEKGLEDDRKDLEHQRLSLLYERVSLRKQMINMDNPPSSVSNQTQPSLPPSHPIFSPNTNNTQNNDMMEVDSSADTSVTVKSEKDSPKITTL